jgi:hypothetical protein
MSPISNLHYLGKSSFNFSFPVMKTLGLRLVEVGEGTASMEMEVKQSSIRIPWGRFMAESCVTWWMRRLAQLISQLLQMERVSPVSICRSISFDPFGTRSLERLLNNS